MIQNDLQATGIKKRQWIEICNNDDSYSHVSLHVHAGTSSSLWYTDLYNSICNERVVRNLGHKWAKFQFWCTDFVSLVFCPVKILLTPHNRIQYFCRNQISQLEVNVWTINASAKVVQIYKRFDTPGTVQSTESWWIRKNVLKSGNQSRTSTKVNDDSAEANTDFTIWLLTPVRFSLALAWRPHNRKQNFPYSKQISCKIKISTTHSWIQRTIG